MLHKIVKHGGPAYWIKGNNLTLYHSIPYAWHSEANYIEIINWICTVSPSVNPLDFPLWKNFMEVLDSVILDPLNISSPDQCLFA